MCNAAQGFVRSGAGFPACGTLLSGGFAAHAVSVERSSIFRDLPVLRVASTFSSRLTRLHGTYVSPNLTGRTLGTVWNATVRMDSAHFVSRTLGWTH